MNLELKLEHMVVGIYKDGKKVSERHDHFGLDKLAEAKPSVEKSTEKRYRCADAADLSEQLDDARKNAGDVLARLSVILHEYRTLSAKLLRGLPFGTQSKFDWLNAQLENVVSGLRAHRQVNPAGTFSAAQIDQTMIKSPITDWIPPPHNPPLVRDEVPASLSDDLSGDHIRLVQKYKVDYLEASAIATALPPPNNPPLDVSESFENLAIASISGSRVPITKAYSDITVLNIFNTTPKERGSGIAAAWIDKATTIGAGPLIKIFDASGNAVAGTVDVIIEGFATAPKKNRYVSTSPRNIRDSVDIARSILSPYELSLSKAEIEHITIAIANALVAYKVGI